MLMIGNCVCGPDSSVLRKQIMNEAYTAPYRMHPGSIKLYQDLKSFYWWLAMKRDTAEFIARCLTCQQVKAEHQALATKLHPLAILE